jgi:methionine-rich copper-binding protein CopC
MHLRKHVLSIVCLFLGTWTVSAHALLESVTPKAGSTVQGPEVALLLHFNTKIDNARSRLELLTPDKKTVVLKIEPSEKAGDVVSHARDLKQGSYTLRWQVLAIDGHITRGDVPFVVK